MGVELGLSLQGKNLGLRVFEIRVLTRMFKAERERN
jgi:hypothetical protein